jgi:aryl-phospho-beta-D-glucosidase BglC (GH1 family)
MTAAAVALLLLLLAPAGCDDAWRYVTVPTSEKQTIRYRGIHMYDEVSVPAPEADIDKMGRWGVNFTRWWFLDEALPNDATRQQYQAFIVDRCDHLDTYMEALERNNIKVCIVLGSYPGGKRPIDNWTCNMFYDQTLAETFVQAWTYISTRYKDNPTVVMYDLMNEPGIIGDATIMLPDLFLQTAQAIRAQGDNTEIVYEPVTTTDYDGFEPFNLPGIVYSVHVYAPGALTHQGISGNPIGVAYPGDIDGAYWLKARIRDAHRAAKRFADTYGVRIFVGEFGCARWAPENSSYYWTKDCLEYFEEEGWDYIFFSLEPTPADCSYTNTGATMWSPEYDTEYLSHCPVESTDRLELLKSYWSKNK